MVKTVTPLQEISPDSIKQNKDNPRLIFKEDEMTQLLESIKEVGIKVPLSVYADGTKYILIDGERRWRCAKKLNLKTVPSIIQPKPTPLENLLMMFNIHNVRVDWELMPMALKLGQIRDMLEKDGKAATPKSLSAITGVKLPTVRRALDLLDLPKKYQAMLLKEAAKPRHEQRMTADVFIEVYKSLHVVERHNPDVFKKVTKAEYVDSMVQKYVHKVIDSVVGYREVSKIARAELAGVSKEAATPSIVKLVRDRNYSIKQAFADTVQVAYEKRDLLSKIKSITEKLAEYKPEVSSDAEIRSALDQLRSEINRLLR